MRAAIAPVTPTATIVETAIPHDDLPAIYYHPARRDVSLAPQDSERGWLIYTRSAATPEQLAGLRHQLATATLELAHTTRALAARETILKEVVSEMAHIVGAHLAGDAARLVELLDQFIARKVRFVQSTGGMH